MNEPFFHVGILVRDIEAPRPHPPPPPGPDSHPVPPPTPPPGDTTRFRYSLQGPPYLELTEMTGTGSWSPELPEGFHHIGLSDPSLPARCAAFGDRVDVIAPGDTGSPRVVLTPAEALHGVRVEYFDAATAAQFLGYLRSRTAG